MTRARFEELNRQVIALYQEGRYPEASGPAGEALSLAERLFGPEHPDTAMSLNNLAELYRAQGRYGDAEPLHRRALAIREEALGPSIPIPR